MDISSLLQPRVRDHESLQEFVDDFNDQVPVIEHDVARLKGSPYDKTLVAGLFRALHNIKGNAAICKVDLAVAIAHPIETLLARVRADEIEFSDLLAEVILLAMDRMELSLEALSSGRPIAQLKLPELVGGLELLAAADKDVINERSVALIEAVTGFRPVVAARALRPRGSVVGRSSESVAGDLRFFRSLALQFESRSPLFEGRSKRLLQFALDTNEVAGKPIAPAQLEAAVYLHDVGMMFLPESVWLKVEKLSDEDKRQMHAHPTLGAALLERMDGWQEAAQMVAQHHEMPDGRGYPLSLGNEEICAGAKILAIVDAFEAVTLKHSNRGQSRSLVRAIAEVNACDNQFAPEWIEPFNTVVRRMLET